MASINKEEASPSTGRVLGVDPLSAIDEITTELEDREALEADEAVQAKSKRSMFLADFMNRIEQDVRPAMQSVIERLRKDGGGGIIVERPEDLSRLFSLRYTLWMSLVGEIEGTPRQDRHPYLQLDAKVDAERVDVSEGDLWQDRAGGTSGKIAEWTLAEMTADQITGSAIEILRRSAR